MIEAMADLNAIQDAMTCDLATDEGINAFLGLDSSAPVDLEEALAAASKIPQRITRTAKRLGSTLLTVQGDDGCMYCFNMA